MLKFDPPLGTKYCDYSGNWTAGECNAADGMKNGIKLYTYNNSYAMQPVVYYGGFYDGGKCSCTKKCSQQNLVVRMCDNNFQKTIDTFENVGELVRPANMCDIKAGYTDDTWNLCSPDRAIYTIRNAGEPTGDNCKESGEEETGCGSRCVCQDKLASAANSYYQDNSHWKIP